MKLSHERGCRVEPVGEVHHRPGDGESDRDHLQRRHLRAEALPQPLPDGFELRRRVRSGEDRLVQQESLEGELTQERVALGRGQVDVERVLLFRDGGEQRRAHSFDARFELVRGDPDLNGVRAHSRCDDLVSAGHGRDLQRRHPLFQHGSGRRRASVGLDDGCRIAADVERHVQALQEIALHIDEDAERTPAGVQRRDLEERSIHRLAVALRDGAAAGTEEPRNPSSRPAR